MVTFSNFSVELRELFFGQSHADLYEIVLVVSEDKGGIASKRVCLPRAIPCSYMSIFLMYCRYLAYIIAFAQVLEARRS